MIKVELNKINQIEYLRFFSDINHYIKITGSEELFTEVVALSDAVLDVVETDIVIIATIPPEPRQEVLPEVEKMKSIENFAIIGFKSTMPTLTHTEILKCELLVEEWTKGAYVMGDIRRLNEQVWECCQQHNSNINTDVIPGQSPAHWFSYHSKEKEYAKPWVKPTMAQDAYQSGEYMIFTNGITYKSLIDANTWSPAEYPAGWTLA